LIVRIIAAGSAVVLTMGCASHSVDTAKPVDNESAMGIAKLKAATSAFRQLDSAVAAGYPREVADCLVHEHHGAMGYHHVNRSYLAHDIDAAKPQILLYERMPDNAYKLNAVEFIIPYRLWPRDSIAPTLSDRLCTRKTISRSGTCTSGRGARIRMAYSQTFILMFSVRTPREKSIRHFLFSSPSACPLAPAAPRGQLSLSCLTVLLRIPIGKFSLTMLRRAF
jgi:hypothetical protein